MILYYIFCVCCMAGFIFGDNESHELGTVVVVLILSPILTPYFIGRSLMEISNK